MQELRIQVQEPDGSTFYIHSFDLSLENCYEHIKRYLLKTDVVVWNDDLTRAQVHHADNRITHFDIL